MATNNKNIIVVTDSTTKSKYLTDIISEFSTKKWKIHEIDFSYFSLPKTGPDFDSDYNLLWEINKNIFNLKKALLKAEEVYICTDLDPKGEALAYLLQEIILKHSEAKASRIIFTDISQTTLLLALKIPDTVDEELANSYFARLAIERLIEKSVKPYIKNAGNITDAKGHNLTYNIFGLPLLYELLKIERKRRFFIKSKKYQLEVEICKNTAKAYSELLNSKEEAINLIEKIRDAEDLETLEIDYAEQSIEIKPYSPFTTSSLYRHISNKLRLRPNEIITALRYLYDNGKITFFKTNSNSINRKFSERLWTYIRAEGKSITEKPKYYSGFDRGEAIRISEFVTPEEFNKTEKDKIIKDVYEIIWNRTINTQLIGSKIKKQSVDYTLDKGETLLMSAEGTIVDYEGPYLSKINQTLEKKLLHRLGNIEIKETETVPFSRLSLAEIIKWLDTNSIGKAENYEEILDDLFENNYIKENEEGEIFILPRGEIICVILENILPELLDPTFAAQLEEEITDIEKGGADYKDVIKYYEDWANGLKLHNKYSVHYPKTCPQCLNDQLEGTMDFKNKNPYVKCKKCKWMNFVTFDNEGNVLLSN